MPNAKPHRSQGFQLPGSGAASERLLPGTSSWLGRECRGECPEASIPEGELVSPNYIGGSFFSGSLFSGSLFSGSFFPGSFLGAGGTTGGL